MSEYQLHSDLPVGLNVRGERQEHDALGMVAVAADRYWGAQTQRSLIHFSIGTDRMPLELCRAYALVKKAAAQVNREAGRLPEWKAAAIIQAANEVADGRLDAHFPLFVWQTGSGTQTNMNVNEVIANRAIQLLGGMVGSQTPIHPNDDVNMGQSSNDTFPTAMHVATVHEIDTRLLPELDALAALIETRSREWQHVVKIGRTHLQDAVPLTVGQEWSGWAHQIRDAMRAVRDARGSVLELAAGGTAVGTGLNAPAGFGRAIAARLAELTGAAFVTAPNKFAALAGLDAMVRVSSAIRGCAVVMMKIANDMRWLGSGPRCGLAELCLPANEPGSSIMPGKVNPTQCEAMVMICTQILGNDAAIAFAGSQGQFELNVMRPVVIANLLHSLRILADGARTFRVFSVEGTRLNLERIRRYVEESVMLVTALTPAIGYDRASAIAHDAMEHGLSLREAALRSGLVDAETFDRSVRPMDMVGRGEAGA
ncbi:class II fumarate hydratase [Gluconacetobacter sacchari]|uniref:class II fumarate hydratase n=1 Tax=Gluconacetobacter sacchari TaxID=92759 RepID=UPI0039B470A1